MKDLEVLLDEKLDAVQKTNCVGGCIKISVVSRLREEILSLCSSETPPAGLHPGLGLPA